MTHTRPRTQTSPGVLCRLLLYDSGRVCAGVVAGRVRALRRENDIDEAVRWVLAHLRRHDELWRRDTGAGRGITREQGEAHARCWSEQGRDSSARHTAVWCGAAMLSPLRG
eukprot:1626603-Pleurochrysis_carterae.AAC.5